MITASIGRLVARLHMLFGPQPESQGPAASFQRSLRNVPGNDHDGFKSSPSLLTTTGIITADLSSLIPMLKPLSDWRQFVFGRTEVGKYEHLPVAPPDRLVSAIGYRGGVFRNQLTGFNCNKLSPAHPDAMNLKYVAARIFEQIDVYSADPTAAAVAVFNELGIPATRVGKDKIDFGNGQGPVDVVRNMTAHGETSVSGRAWQWIPVCRVARSAGPMPHANSPGSRCSRVTDPSRHPTPFPGSVAAVSSA